MFSDNLVALPTLLWIGEHPFWTLLTLFLLFTHFLRSPVLSAGAGERARFRDDKPGGDPADPVRRGLVSSAAAPPLAGGDLQPAGRAGAGEDLGILLFQFLLPLCQIRIPRIIADIVITVGYIGWCLFLPLRLRHGPRRDRHHLRRHHRRHRLLHAGHPGQPAGRRLDPARQLHRHR